MLNDKNYLLLENSGYSCDGEVIFIAIGEHYGVFM
jgi:hypothetical protein